MARLDPNLSRAHLGAWRQKGVWRNLRGQELRLETPRFQRSPLPKKRGLHRNAFSAKSEQVGEAN